MWKTYHVNMSRVTFTISIIFSLFLSQNSLPVLAHARDIRNADAKSASEPDVNIEEMRSLLAQSFSQNQGDDQDLPSDRRVHTDDMYPTYEQAFYANENEVESWNFDENRRLNSKSKLVESDAQHNIKSHPSIKSQINTDKLPSNIKEEDIAATTTSTNQLKSNARHSVSIEIVPHKKRESASELNLEITIPSDASSDSNSQHAQTLQLQAPNGQLIGQSSSNINDKAVYEQFSNLWQTVGGIYWSPQLEHLSPVGFSDTQTVHWRHKVDTSRVSDLAEGCGRMQNRLVTLDDGSQMCARYRINTDQIQGEVYSYYLAQVLGIDNVPPAILDRPDASNPRWSNAAKAVDAAKWNPRKILVLTPFVRDLQKVYIPVELRTEERELSPTTPTVVNKTIDELIELRQWSDLVVLDYLTGNVDRVVNNMFNLQWSAGMMSAPTHNLERSGAAGPLIFMDNESGLLHSYRLLDKYSHYHDKMLRALCIFRRSTANAIKKYHKTNSLATDMKELFKAREPLSEKLAWLPQGNIQTLNQRLAAVYRQIIHCEHKYQPKHQREQ